MSVLHAALVCSAVVLLLLYYRNYRYKRGLRNLRGPPSPSLLYGNEYQLFHQTETGTLDFQWMREYGPTWRAHSYFGTGQLMTADPKALQHIFNKSTLNYPKRAGCDVHQRHRRVMSPAFTAQQLRTFIPLFQRTAQKMVGYWKGMIDESKSKTGGVILVNKWLGRSSLDIIGKAAFDYHFGALDNQDTPLAKEYSTIIFDSLISPSKASMLYRATWTYIPHSVLKLTKYTPMAIYGRFRKLDKMFASVGRPLIKASIEEGADKREGKRDVLSILAKANADESARFRLGDAEVLAQMHTLTAAGHETTSNTLTWMLYELAKCPEYQTRVREEVRETRAAVVARGDEDFTLDDLDGMKCTLAAIKETLRFHPIVYNLWRYALKDDVIPLSQPVIGKDGTAIDGVAVSAGQAVTISICGYNRLKSVWGEDADRWNPERFFNQDTEKQVKVGAVSNLMTFSSGIQGCIGWRFALNQLQAFSAELLEHFEFSLPEDKPHILRTPAGFMTPIIEGKEHMGAAMPLKVSLVG